MGTYNGWYNYETWQAALWLDEYDYRGHLEGYDIQEQEVTEDSVKRFIEVFMLDLDSIDGFMLDIVTGWMGAVNWNEIVSAFNEE